MRIGLFGGTFDPIHIAHLIVAEEVRLAAALDQVLFIPASRPWLKADRDIAAPEHRLQMVRLAIASNPFFEVSTAELDRPGPSYTVDTVEAMRRSARPGDELYFIAGADALADMPRWKDPSRLMTLCRIIAVERPGAAPVNPEALIAFIPGVCGCITPIKVPQMDISSTMIRDRVRKGLPVRYLVPPEVERYILEHRVYSV